MVSGKKERWDQNEWEYILEGKDEAGKIDTIDFKIVDSGRQLGKIVKT